MGSPAFADRPPAARLDRRAWLAGGLRELPPGSFAFVMATGILSVGFAGLGRPAVSTLLLLAAAAGYLALCCLLGLRLARFPAEVWADTGRASRAFGFFTFVAASEVLAVRLEEAGWTGPALVLAAAGAAVFVLLSYGLPARIVLAGDRTRPDEAVNGTWLIWVVGTESVSIGLATVGFASGFQPRVVALAAVSVWAFGSLLYLLLMGIILARLFLAPLSPVQAAPPYWISMGATAITVLAGADLLGLPRELPSLAASRSSVEGLTLFLWAFGTWWFPFLIVLTVWRYRMLSGPVYEPALWSLVFPLGMYAVATDAYGRAAGLPILPEIAHAEIWLALAAWLAVAGWMAVSWFSPGWPSGGRSRDAVAMARQ